MRLLVTAGNTQAPIDAVRCITNIFTGRTGAGIAAGAAERGHDVTLLTSHPETAASGSVVKVYRTFDDLRSLMQGHIREGEYDAVIHSAAVSDYLVAGVYTSPTGPPRDPAIGKVKSDAPELWLRLVKAPKLIDAVRSEWGFRGVLVKFKLEVGVDDEPLLEIAERSRRDSDADLMVANALERYAEWAWLGPTAAGQYQRVSRVELPDRLLEAIEALHGGQ